MLPKFVDRRHAGAVLARALGRYANRPDVIVLALPRGGVPVGFEVAVALGAPLDVYVVRKLGVPGHEEFAFGAIASGGVRFLDPRVAPRLTPEVIERTTAQEQQELERREARYRGGSPFPELAERCVLLVDDGLATGATMRAAIQAVRLHRPAEVVVAVPVAASDTCDEIRALVDATVCVCTPDPFHAVGLWYRDFSATTDAEVAALLRDGPRPTRISV